MMEQKSAVEIGRFNYEHWTGKSVDRSKHDIALIPQTMADGWDAFCSCGEWRGFQSMMEMGRDEAIALLKQRHAEHAAG